MKGKKTANDPVITPYKGAIPTKPPPSSPSNCVLRGVQLLAGGDLAYGEMDGTDLHLVHDNADLGIGRSRVTLIADYRGTRITVTALVVAVWVCTDLQWRVVTIQSTSIP